MTFNNYYMRVSGLSVPEVVREIITRNRSIYDCMKMDLINYTALAVKIQPEVERIIGNPINLNTIVVGIKRYADSFENKDEIRNDFVLKNARLSLTDGILDIKFSSNQTGELDPTSLLNKFSQITNDYEFFRLTDSFRFLAEDVEEVRKFLEGLPSGQNLYSGGLAKIKITIPYNQNRSDVVSFVAEILHSTGIEIVNAFFSNDSIVLVLHEKDASRAYEILRSEISRSI